MGIWAKLAGGAMAVGGFITGNPALIGAGASIIGQDIASSGAEKAADQQIEAAERARTDANTRYDATRQEQRQIYDQSAANFAPYIGLGQGVLPTLGSMVGLKHTPAPMAPQAHAVGPVAPVVEAAPTGVQAMTQSPAQSRAEQLGRASTYGKREGMSMGRMAGMVLLQSPDGKERRLVPRSKAEQAIALGATEIG